jgi:serine/threonine protein kinase
MPDLLLQDLDPEFLLKQEEIKYQEDKDSLLGEGGFGKVYRGKCRGKSVAIKKYLTRTEDAFNELRSEAKVLHNSHHPCLVCLVGVSVYPLMALVLEEAPMGSFEKHLIKKSTAISRLVMFRISAQVAAAIRFLHQHGIIFRDLKAANVLLWSLDESSLCHAKVTDFGIATHLSPTGVLGIQGTKGFIAPEVLFLGRKKAIYNHKADVFSFGMLLYQMIARRHPYHNVQPVKIDAKVVQGERPSIVDTPVAETGYYFLTRLMKRCWEDKPDERPSTTELITDVSDIIFQSVMGIHPVRSRFSIRRGCAITPHNYARANVTSHVNSELWICCDGSEGAELNIYNTNRLVKLSKNFIKENQVQCMSVCGDHVWVCSRAGIEYGVIDIFSMITRELVHNIRMRENAVSCITCSENTVYLGTLEGYCFSFDMDLKTIQTNCRPKYRYISEHAIDGIAVTKKHVWVSHTRFMFFLNLDTLALEYSYKRSRQIDAFVGHLAISSQEDNGIVWSAHLGGCTLSAWDAENETLLYDVDVREVLLKQVGIGDKSEFDAIITCITPALDTVWVGMATGHILLFHNQELLINFHPYDEYVRFVITVPCEGPCQKEKCMVVTGGKGFQSPLPHYDIDPADLTDEDKTQPIDKSGVMILWEAFSGETLRKMLQLQSESGGYLDNHKSVAKMIKTLNFRDDTHILEENTNRTDVLSPTVSNELSEAEILDDDRGLVFSQSMYGSESDRYTNKTEERTSNTSSSPEPINNTISSETEIEGQPFSFRLDAQRMLNEENPEEEEEEIVRPRTRSYAVVNEIFDIDMTGLLQGETLRISCPKPVTLHQILIKISNEGNFQNLKDFDIAYRQGDSGEVISLTTEEKFTNYMELNRRPMLLLVQK